MIDALFGSKTRVKLLKLFLNNPDDSYFVREITRLIDEQINSVRRELSNMLKIGIITSKSVENKLYYSVDQKYKYFIPLRAIFSDEKITLTEAPAKSSNEIIGLPAKIDPEVQFYSKLFEGLNGAHAVVLAGRLVRGSASSIDVLIVGEVASTKLKTIIKSIERREGADINYTVLAPDDFQYRLSVRDRFVGEILDTNHTIIKNIGRIITGGKK